MRTRAHASPPVSIMARPPLSTRVPELRRRLAEKLDPMLREKTGLSWTHRLVCALILASLLMTILRTEVTVDAGRERLFMIADLGLTALLGAVRRSNGSGRDLTLW